MQHIFLFPNVAQLTSIVAKHTIDVYQKYVLCVMSNAAVPRNDDGDRPGCCPPLDDDAKTTHQQRYKYKPILEDIR